MSIKPTQVPELSGSHNRYSLVIAVAKIARRISEEASRKEEILTEKPVDLAVRKMVDNRYVITPIEVSDDSIDTRYSGESAVYRKDE